MTKQLSKAPSEEMRNRHHRKVRLGTNNDKTAFQGTVRRDEGQAP